ncbi:hypothetical protein MSC49_37060 (plasmid) [Methylosinus sp. C49]|nr:hypothetical protein MSC49_37060 [Methylosinus sp. C49]
MLPATSRLTGKGRLAAPKAETVENAIAGKNPVAKKPGAPFGASGGSIEIDSFYCAPVPLTLAQPSVKNPS